MGVDVNDRDAQAGALWDEALLTRACGALDWGRLSAMASALSAEPGGWRRVLAVFDASFAKDYAPDDAGWLRCPYVLAEIGQGLDDAGRREIARELLQALRDVDENEDFLIETLTEAIGLLGPSVLPEVSDELPRTADRDAGWSPLQSLLDLATWESATDAQRAIAIEAAEAVLRRGLAGEFDVAATIFASWTLAKLGHTPSVGLIERSAGRWPRSDSFLAHTANEHAEALKELREKGKADPDPSPPHWFGTVRSAAEHAWSLWLDALERDEQERQSDFTEMYDVLMSESPIDRLPGATQGHAWQPPAMGKVGRNDPCPCGSGKKYKKCCLR
jgi:hypothetical protein